MRATILLFPPTRSNKQIYTSKTFAHIKVVFAFLFVFGLQVNFLRDFGIKHNRYAFCRLALVGKTAISLPVQSCSGGMASYPKLAN